MTTTGVGSIALLGSFLFPSVLVASESVYKTNWADVAGGAGIMLLACLVAAALRA